MDSVDSDCVAARHAIAIRLIKNLRQKFRMNSIPTEIEKGLFLGSINDAKDSYQLKQLNITHMLTVIDSPQPFSKDLLWMGINIKDNRHEDISKHFDQCFEFIDKAKEGGGAVLVHCLLGRSRSVTIVVAYLMKKHGMSLSQALELVKSKRPVACPNNSFITHLEKFEKSLLALKEKETA